MYRWMRVLIAALWLPLLAGAQGTNTVVVLTVDDAIGPATSDYVHRGLEQAAARNAALVVMRLNTPGGLDLAMRDVVRDIVASPVPVVVYVAPSGARAASAGTFMLYAAHLAAMAPATNVGAATPVQIGGIPDLDPSIEPRDTDSKKKQETKDQSKAKERGPKTDAGEARSPPDNAMAKKVVNDAVAYIRSLAQMRRRNAEWAEKAVREGVSLSAEEALAQGVIELIAGDLPQLLAAIDGREVQVQGLGRRLHTQGALIETIDPDWRSRVLAVITNPNVAYLLLLLGIYGLFFELVNPGYALPGVVGAISILLALYALQLLPVNYAGLILILLGIAFMISEVFVAGFGALGMGGVIAFVVGSVILFDTDINAYAVSLPLIGGFALLTAGFFIGVTGMALKLYRRPAVTGVEEMIGSLGEALEDFSGSGRVRAHGECWRACSNTPLKRGQKVRVTKIEGLTLLVEPATEEQ